jgi:hypothetical protein
MKVKWYPQDYKLKDKEKCMTYNELKDRARELGIEVKGNPAADTLEEQVRVAEEEAAISGKDAKVEKQETASVPVNGKKKVMSRQDAMEMIKVKITPLDEAMKGLPSDMFTVANKNIGSITQVVVFNKPCLVFRIIVDMLRVIQMPVGITGDDGVVRFDLVEAYSVTEVPFTEEEKVQLGLK